MNNKDHIVGQLTRSKDEKHLIGESAISIVRLLHQGHPCLRLGDQDELNGDDHSDVWGEKFFFFEFVVSISSKYANAQYQTLGWE